MVRIGGEDVSCLEVQVEGRKKVYRIPLANDLPMGQVMKIRRINRMPKEEQAEAMAAFFYELACDYIDKDVVDSLSQSAFSSLIEEYDRASKDAGADLGE